VTLFVHSKSPLKTVEPEPSHTVGDLIAAEGGGELWLENAETPLDAAMPLAELPANAHVSRGTCKRVAVTAQYNGEKIEKEFPQGATVAAVFAWAVGGQGFDLPASQRPKHTLALCGTETEPDKSTHLSELVGEDCSVCFAVVPKHRFEG